MATYGNSSQMKLDSAHLPIGMTQASLDEYIKKLFIRKPFTTYWIVSWKIQAA